MEFGTLLFSGSIFLLLFLKHKGWPYALLGPVTPIGGTLMIAGWGHWVVPVAGAWMNRTTFVNYPRILPPISTGYEMEGFYLCQGGLSMISPTSWYIKETLLSGPIWPKGPEEGPSHLVEPRSRPTDWTDLLSESRLTSTGALAIETGRFTGRSPLDRFIVRDGITDPEVWWGDINQPLFQHANRLHRPHGLPRRQRALCPRCFRRGAPGSPPVLAGPRGRRGPTCLPTTCSAPSAEETAISSPSGTSSAPRFKADAVRHGTRQSNFAVLDFTHRRILIEARVTGEIKKGMFSAMNFLLPTESNVLPMLLGQ